MKNSNKGEIATILTVAALVVVGLSTIISTFFLQSSKNKLTSNSRAEEGVWNCPGGQCNMCGQDGPWGRTGGCGSSPDAPPGVKPGWRPPAECGGREFQCAPPDQGNCGNDGCVNDNPKAPYGLRGGYELTPTVVPPPKPTETKPPTFLTPTPAPEGYYYPGTTDVNPYYGCTCNETSGLYEGGACSKKAQQCTTPALLPCDGFTCGGPNDKGSCYPGYSEKCKDVSGVKSCCKKIPGSNNTTAVVIDSVEKGAWSVGITVGPVWACPEYLVSLSPPEICEAAKEQYKNEKGEIIATFENLDPNKTVICIQQLQVGPLSLIQPITFKCVPRT